MMKFPKTRSVLGFSSGICSVGVIIGALLTYYGDEVRTSQAGLEIIGNAEGCRRDPYICPANVLTVGIGSTAASGEKIDPSHTYSDMEIAERWKNDIVVAERCVNQYANGARLPQSVFDATVSITFNVGCGTMRKSTLFRMLNERTYHQACEQFPRWVYAGGKKLNGLVSRREKEKALCLADLTSR